MKATPKPSLLDQLRRRLGPPGGVESDAQLLARWQSQGDATALEALIWRHGAMVHAVCRRVLGHTQDAEDAFQACFLVFVRKASGIARGEAVGGWLHTVATRVALEARARKHERSRREEPLFDAAAPDRADRETFELRQLLDAELHGLPTRYRVPLVLCYLEGKSAEQAAAEIGCPRGTILSRLLRGRERLRQRLVRRGVMFASSALLAQLNTADAGPPAALVRSALARVAPAGQTTPAPAAIESLTQGVLRTMRYERLRLTLLHAAAAVLAVVAVGWTLQTGMAGPEPEAPRALAVASPEPQLARGDDPKAALRKELDKFKGSWTTVEMDFDGAAVPGDLAGKLRHTFTEDKSTWEGSLFKAGNKWAFKDGSLDMPYKIDPTRKPRQIDFDLNGKAVVGIYEFNGDRLKLCFSYTGERPTTFSSKDKSGCCNCVMEREKK